jgi:DNA-binding transcriptional LysR family regulator
MPRLAWSDLQDFLAMARAGNLSRAAAALGIDPTTVGRRLRRLERHVGQTLFELTRGGQTLTEAGEKLLAQAESMQAITDGIAEVPEGRSAFTGLVRMSASEGFGTSFIARHLPEFAKRHPTLTIDLAATTGFLSPSMVHSGAPLCARASLSRRIRPGAAAPVAEFQHQRAA